MQAFRTRPPEELSGVRLERLRDYREQVVRKIPGGQKLGDLKTTKGDLLFLDSAAGGMQFSIAARPSGTEPKIKFYFFARTNASPSTSLEAVKKQTVAQMHEFQEALMEWVHQNLREPFLIARCTREDLKRRLARVRGGQVSNLHNPYGQFCFADERRLGVGPHRASEFH